MRPQLPPRLARLADRRPDQDSFSSRLHEQRTAAILGMALGVTFSICFLTGLISFLHQNPVSWFTIPPRPAGLYRVTQGLHVTTGIASIPLLLAKLWVVYPQFWTRPAVRDAAHLVERISLLPLVGGSVFLLFTGVINIARWYSAMPFFFPVAHRWAAWMTMGALVVHVAAKWATTRQTLLRRGPAPSAEAGPAPGGLGRRGFLATVFGSSALLAATTAGQTLPVLRRLNLLSPRDLDVGTQGLPINRTAAEAGVVDLIDDPGYRLSVEGEVTRSLSLTVGELRSRELSEAELPIACVEGWSASARWRGIRVRDLLDEAGASKDAVVRIESFEPRGLYGISELNRLQARDPDTLLALEVNGEALDADHGAPLRLIAPNRAGVEQTKWVNRLVVGERGVPRP